MCTSVRYSRVSHPRADTASGISNSGIHCMATYVRYSIPIYKLPSGNVFPEVQSFIPLPSLLPLSRFLPSEHIPIVRLYFLTAKFSRMRKRKSYATGFVLKKITMTAAPTQHFFRTKLFLFRFYVTLMSRKKKAQTQMGMITIKKKVSGRGRPGKGNPKKGLKLAENNS